jgi:hypothetical protein
MQASPRGEAAARATPEAAQRATAIADAELATSYEEEATPALVKTQARDPIGI